MTEAERSLKRIRAKRALANEGDVTAQTAVFGRFLTDRLAVAARELERSNFSLTGSISSELAPGDRKQFLETWVKGRLFEPLPLLKVTLDPGNRLIGPPYDTQWSEGSGVIGAWTVKEDGELFTMSLDGFSASGVGIFLDAPQMLDVAVTPLGNSVFHWFAVTNNPNVRSRGGIGVVVYEVGNDTPIRVSEAKLWNVVGTSAFTGGQGGGPIADAVTGTTSFGHIRLSPTLFTMHPGKRYLYWVWLWQTFAPGGDDGFVCFQTAEIPAIAVSAGPPVVIH